MAIPFLGIVPLPHSVELLLVTLAPFATNYAIILRDRRMTAKHKCLFQILIGKTMARGFSTTYGRHNNTPLPPAGQPSPCSAGLGEELAGGELEEADRVEASLETPWSFCSTAA